MIIGTLLIASLIIPPAYFIYQVGLKQKAKKSPDAKIELSHAQLFFMQITLGFLAYATWRTQDILAWLFR